MRPIDRIPIFLQKVDFDKLQERWDIDIPQSLRGIMCEKEFRSSWEEVSDQRFGQFLINLNYIPDKFDIWIDEESSILNAQGIPKRETMLWGNNYDKDMNRLPKTIWQPIAEMNTEHIKAILDGGWANSNLPYKQVFEEELKLRETTK